MVFLYRLFTIFGLTSWRGPAPDWSEEGQLESYENRDFNISATVISKIKFHVLQKSLRNAQIMFSDKPVPGCT